MGDPAGIGPEIAIKALNDFRFSIRDKFLLIGDLNLWNYWNQQLATPLLLKPYDPQNKAEQFFVLDTLKNPVGTSVLTGSVKAANAAIHWLREGANKCLNFELDALVTGPVNKKAIISAGVPFIGQTEFLSEIASSSRTIMMLLGQDDKGQWLRVALVTTHLPLRQVADRLKTEKIELAIELAAEACRKLGLLKIRIGVCGLNPHAGEGGTIGTEEIKIIAPAIQNARRKKIDVIGPLAADTLFYKAYNGDFEAVVAMYHDQGLGPLKMIGFERGINWTLGLPFIRTSPDHGTAYDIAGKGIANASSMRAAIGLALKLIRRE